jgi:hypothetical protein
LAFEVPKERIPAYVFVRLHSIGVGVLWRVHHYLLWFVSEQLQPSWQFLS